MNVGKVYNLNSYQYVLSHFPTPLSYVRDGEEAGWQDRKLEIAAHVSSGDYFATIATKLDRLSVSIEEADKMAAHELERLVDELLYLQRTYKITKK